MPLRRSTRLSLGLVLAAGLFAAACGADTSDVDSDAVAPSPTATAERSGIVGPTPSPTATPVPVPSPTPFVFVLDPVLIRKFPKGWTPEVAADLAVGPTDAAPAGGRLGKVRRNGSRWKYRGVLGKLDPDDMVVAPAADPVQAVAGTAPLTGLSGPERANRRAVVVKIDNVPQARPQVGLAAADIVYEELVESGFTRLAAVFHSKLPDVVGPIRSGRSTDIGIVDSFAKPVFAFSGANSIFQRLIDDQPIHNRSDEVWAGYWRDGGRAAPHNLFGSASTLAESAPAGKAPRPHFAYRSAGEELPAGAKPAKLVQLVYSEGGSPAIRYEWNAKAGEWRRWQSGTQHLDATGTPLAAENLIVQLVDYIDTGLTDKWGEDLYEGVSVGTGGALVFTQGHVIEAVWTRPSLKSPATFTDRAGNHIELTPGQTHVSLIAPGGVSWG